MSALPTPASNSGEFPYDDEILRCAQGDHRALERLYQQESSRLMGVAFRILNDRSQAEDVLHDTFVNAWNKAHTFDPRRGLGRAWLYSITRHLALNLIRDNHGQATLDEDTLTAMDTEAAMDRWADMQDHFQWRSMEGRLTHCLGHLETVRRNCLLHAYVDGLSHSQIAQKLDAPVGSVKAWIKRGLVALRECMA
ncbi:MAG: sigma-70 family RNA polymerase sigma factor [Limnobacter sp.]|uniref:sigma-70 family RNA polymerase sigma factor n=1 Tax=Limnobacter sp. TaxID=2003368 RepID=UPI003918B438